MIAKEVLSWKPLEKRLLGRPKQQLFDKILNDLTTLGMENYREIALDKGKWKYVCIAAIGINGL